MLNLQFGEVNRVKRLAEKLSTIPGCRMTQGAIDAIAEDLIELCDSWDEAEWIVKEARSQWDEWKGRRGLIQLLESRRRPELPPSNQAVDLGPKPEVDCKTCFDWGHYYDETAKRNVRCGCGMGLSVSDAFLKALNRQPEFREVLSGRPEKRRRISQDEIDREFSNRQNTIARLIAQERFVLESEASSPERKEIARLNLKGLGVAESEVSA